MDIPIQKKIFLIYLFVHATACETHYGNLKTAAVKPEGMKRHVSTSVGFPL
jgi:hypothetical protein